MNVCKRFQCDTCETLIDCRIGMSNRDIQPFQFACPNCEERISFVFGSGNDELTGAAEIIDFEGPFKGEHPFVDLHLDFPVYFGVYVQGMTTFFRVTEELGLKEYLHLAERLQLLNALLPFKRDLESVITQYRRGDLDKFEKTCKKLPAVTLKSHKKQDVLAAIYTATSSMSSPFTIHEQNKELASGSTHMYRYLHSTFYDNTVKFIDEILGNGFLMNLHYDCLSLYPKILDMDLPLRPAFFYDYLQEEEYRDVPARVSTAYFDSCNNFYKDLAEVFSRQLTLLAGLNNLLKRGDHNEFEPSLKVTEKQKPRNELASLSKYADIDLGRKLNFIDNSFYNINMDAIDNRLRNGIAHYKYQYKESTQIITYYPSKEGMKRLKSEDISFMAFLRKTLLLFREVHSLNHLIKSTLYYSVLVLNKDV